MENIFRLEQDFAALNIIEFWDKYPVVKLMNGIIRVCCIVMLTPSPTPPLQGRRFAYLLLEGGAV